MAALDRISEAFVVPEGGFGARVRRLLAEVPGRTWRRLYLARPILRALEDQPTEH